MEKLLDQILGHDLLTEENKALIVEGFKKALDEAKVAQEKNLRAEFAKLYDHDKVKMAEAVEQYIESRLKKEISELRSNMIALEKQREQYVEATESVKANAKIVIEKRLKVLEAVIERALGREIGELREDMKTNRKAVLKTIAEVRARGEADRNSFKTKAARVLEHIINVKLQKEIHELREDIFAAKKNDMANRIMEAFLPEARRLFFNASKEHRALVQQIKSLEESHTKEVEGLKKSLGEAETKAKKATTTAAKLHESIQRSQTMNRLLSTVPAGTARSKMKTLLEATATADLDKTFKKYVGSLLTEARQPVGQTKRLSEAAVELRTGSPKQVLAESNTSADDEDIVRLRSRAGMPAQRANRK